MALSSASIYRLRPIDEPDQAIDPEILAELNSAVVQIPGASRAMAYWRSGLPTRPGWTTFIDSLVEEDVDWPQSTSVAGLLIIHTTRAWFALTFGGGRHLLASMSFVRGFGRRCIPALIDPERLRGISSMAMDRDGMRASRTATRNTGFQSFDIQFGRDMVQGVTGAARDHDQVKRMTGVDAVQITGNITRVNLVGLLDDLLDAEDAGDPDEDFSWLHQFREVDDPNQIAILNDALPALLEGLGDVPVAPPEAIDWSASYSFRFWYGRNDMTSIEALPNFHSYRQGLALRNLELTAEMLRSHRLRIVDTANGDELVGQWSVLECLTVERVHDENLHVLIDGVWHQVHRDQVDLVDELLEAVDTTNPGLPPMVNPNPGETFQERHYNSRVAEQNGWALMDRRDFRTRRTGTPVEACDLMTPDGHIIHVKIRHSSSSLSHLWTQAAASANAMVTDRDYRDMWRVKLAELDGTPVAPATVVEPHRSENYRVVLAIVSGQVAEWPQDLPFLVRIGMAHSIQQLTSYGFSVSVVRVPDS